MNSPSLSLSILLSLNKFNQHFLGRGFKLNLHEFEFFTAVFVARARFKPPAKRVQQLPIKWNTHTSLQMQNRNQKYFGCSITNCSLTRLWSWHLLITYAYPALVPPPLCLPSMLTANSQQQAPMLRGMMRVMVVWAWHNAHCVCKLVICIVAAAALLSLRHFDYLCLSFCLPCCLSISLSLLLPACLSLLLSVCPVCHFVCPTACLPVLLFLLLSVSLFVFLSIECCACWPLYQRPGEFDVAATCAQGKGSQAIRQSRKL